MMPACQAGTVFAHGCWKYTWLFANTNYQGDSFMSNVIKFLEKLGQDAQLRGASQEELAEALAKAQVDAPYCSAILAKDTSQLQDLLERSENLYRRIARLDDILFGENEAPRGARGHMDVLAQAFGAK